MSNIRVDVGYTIQDGAEIKFRSPVDCSVVTGLIVYYPGTDGNTASKVFAFADAHGNNVGNIDHLFAENVVVKVILDVTTSMAFVQNADTNAYLEAQLASKRPNTWLPTIAEIGAAPAGYGLGETVVQQIDDANNARRVGWYWLDVGAANSPDSSKYVYLRVDNFDTSSYTQTAYLVDANGSVFKRSSVYGVLGQWVRCDPSAFAPAGYGLGGGSANFNVANIDNMKQSGWFNTSSANGYYIGTVPLYYIVLRVDSWKDTAGYPVVSQTIYCEQCQIRRICYVDGTWSDWEWENPLMLEGVEYRTTERYGGHPVYTKLVPLGSFTGVQNVPVGNGYQFHTRSTATVVYANSNYGVKLADSAITPWIYNGIHYLQVNVGSENVTEGIIQIWYY